MKIDTIKIKEIDNFPNHPYKVIEDDYFINLKNSISENGLLTPLIVRRKENGRYELISGHRRKLAMEMLGIPEAEVIIKELTDDEAIVEMVDSNLQREKILPSEKAFSYRMKLEALNHQGKNISPKGTKSHSVESINDSKTQIYRYIRLTYLIPELLKLVDDTVLKDKRNNLTMGIKPAVELSYLTKEEQEIVYSLIEYEDLTPSHGQAIKIRNLSKEKSLNRNSVEKILKETKGNQNEQISFNKDNIEKVLPVELLKRDKRYIEQYIIKAIDFYRTNEIERGDDYEIEM